MTNTFTIEREPLHAALGRLKRVANNRYMPILACVLFETGNASVDLTVTDMDIRLSETLSATVNAPARVAIPCKALADLIARAPKGGLVGFTVESDHVTVTAGPITSRLATLAAADFPAFWNDNRRPEDAHESFTLAADTWRKIMGTIGHAISDEETRYYLNGVHLESREGGLIAEATDGHRLSRLVIDKPTGLLGKVNVIVPRLFCAETLKALGKRGNPDIAVDIWPAQIRFAWDGGMVYLSKLIDGTFPDADRIIPKVDRARVWSVRAADALAVVTPLVKMASDKSCPVRIELKGSIALSVWDGVDTSCCAAPGDWNGPETVIGFNGRYLIATLSAIEGTAGFTISAPTDPVHVEDSANPRAAHVVMPLRI